MFEKYHELEELFTKSKEYFDTQMLDISKSASKHVTDLGVGNVNADIVFVGEAPGGVEDRQGYPFVGIAGRILRDGLHRADISIEDVWFTNVVKWRPIDDYFKNRKPTTTEVNVCYPLLEKELKIIDPKVIVTLGITALDALTDFEFSTHSIFSLVGNISYEWKGYPLYIMFHPMVVKYQEQHAHIFYENLRTLKSLVIGLKSKDKCALDKLLNL